MTIPLPSLLAYFRSWRRVGMALALVSLIGLGAVPTLRAESPVELDPLLIRSQGEAEEDVTGMGGHDAELVEPPFSNDMLTEPTGEDEASIELNHEMQVVSGASPVDLATGVNRVNLRGFPTPRLRNGFSQTGIPEVLNVERVELIQGPLTPVIGRAAPGGIQNFVTARPKGARQNRFEASVSSLDQQQLRWDSSGLLVPKRWWHRISAGWQEKRGPEDFAFNRSEWLSGVFTYRRSRSTSVMFTLDYSETNADPSPGVPEYRLTSTSRIVGPYRPLATFHGYGPAGNVSKRIASASAQLEGQLTPRVSLHAGVQGWTRALVEDRFTTGQYILDTGKFGGTREPQHTEQPLTALSAHGELTGRWAFLGADHKISLSADYAQTVYRREQRGLQKADRDALPADVRTFDPAAPNYYRPSYNEALYSRILTDREEAADYSNVSLSERAAIWQGKLVVSAGARLDFVTLNLRDEKPGAARPLVHDRVSEITRHAGLNYQLVKNRLLIFANTSTAFEPSTRVDARTGRIQGNETTLGYEVGFKALFLNRKVSATALLFRFYNQNISRRNPLYDDPIADANQTQPQLVAAGEERFTGGTLDIKGQLTPAWSLSGRFTVTEAITTRSPDLPEEVGRALTRLPRDTVSVSTRYAFVGPRLRGVWLSGSLNYVGAYVANYESTSRDYLAYPGYALIGFNAGYGWKAGKKVAHNVSLGVRNAADRDLLAVLARPGAGREFTANYSVVF